MIDSYAPEKDKIICDPFGGCGTTLVEAKLSGHTSIGFDINPVAKLITETKITQVKPKKLLNQKAKFLKEYYLSSEVLCQHHSRIYYWFDPAIIKELDRIYFAIEKIPDRKIRRFSCAPFLIISKIARVG